MVVAVRRLAHCRRALDQLAARRAAPKQTAIDEALIRLALALVADGLI
jgi:hypothetical protein